MAGLVPPTYQGPKSSGDEGRKRWVGEGGNAARSHRCGRYGRADTTQ